MSIDTTYHRKVGKLFHRGWEKAYGNNWYKEEYGWKTMQEALGIEDRRESNNV